MGCRGVSTRMVRREWRWSSSSWSLSPTHDQEYCHSDHSEQEDDHYDDSNHDGNSIEVSDFGFQSGASREYRL